MTKSKFLPDDFNLTVTEEAHRLLNSAMANASGSSLDPASAFWVMRDSAWMDLRRSIDFMHTVEFKGMRGKFFMGLRARVTHDDDDDIPMIQLVMEPTVKPRRTK